MPKYETVISEYNWSKFERKFQAYQDKAEKLGFPTPTYEIIREFSAIGEDAPILGKMYKYTKIEVTFEMPIIKGWEVIGNRERLDGKIYTNVVTNDDVYSYNKSDRIGCGHCGTNRYRNKSILLKNKVGTIIEVGSTCVVDFFGHKVTNIDWFVNREFEGGEWGISGDSSFHFELKRVLEITLFYVENFGYAKASEEGYSTKDRLWDCHLDSNMRYSLFVKPEVTEEHEKKAQKVIDWIRSLNPMEYYSSSYMTNLIQLAEEDYFHPHLLGYAVSMIPAYQREEVKKNKIEEKPSNYVGEIKERLYDIPVTLMNRKGWESMYGWTDLLNFQDEKGNVIVTFYTGNGPTPDLNEHVLLSGTIKDHSEYQGIKQTVVNRIKWSKI